MPLSHLLVPLLLAAAPPKFAGSSTLELSFSSCGGEGAPSVPTIVRRNEWFDVIQRYGEPLLVIRHSAQDRTDGCVDGPREAEVRFEVTRVETDGRKAAPVRFRVQGQDPEVYDQGDWALLKVTRYGCCGAENGYSWLDPADGRELARASTEPKSLQVINRESPQGSIWRLAFGLGSASESFAAEDEAGRAAQAGVLAELVFAGFDRPSQRYAVVAAAGDAEAGSWMVRELAWRGPQLDDTANATWWIDGPPPQAAQVAGMTLEVQLECQCEAAPLKLLVPVAADRFDLDAAKLPPGIGLRAL